MSSTVPKTVGWLAAAGLATAVAPATAQARCAGHDRAIAPEALEQAEAALRCVVDAERRARDHERLDADGRLRLAARRHADDMVDRDYFSHVSPGGGDLIERVRRTGYADGRRRWRVGETLHFSVGRPVTPRQVVDAWLASPPHRRVLLDGTFRAVGVGVVRGAPGRTGPHALTTTLVVAS